MRIALDYQTFCNQAFGGVSRYFSHLAEQLAELGQRVRIFAPLHQNHYAKALPPGIVHGVGLLPYPARIRDLLIAPINRVVAGRAIKHWQPHVVHETFYSRFRSGPESSRTVITVFDMIHELFKDSFPENDPTTEIKRIAIARADHVICISESTRRDLIALFGIEQAKVSCVHLAYEQFPPYKESERAFSPKAARPFLLFVGGRSGYKNFAGFLESVASSAQLIRDFDVVAFGGGRFLGAHKAMVKRLGFRESQVRHILGDDSLLKAHYEKARALVYPSLYEGFGLPPLEAMAHSCPVISSNSSSMPEVIGDAAEFFDPQNTEDMTRAITSVVYSGQRIEQLKALGQERIKRFSWQRCAQDTLAVYKALS